MKSACCILFASILVLGCSTTNRYAKEHQVTTRIVSIPPGARIEINGDYIGDTPVETQIRHHPSDKVVMDRVVIRALPRGSGQYVQLFELNGPRHPFDTNRDVVPESIQFDMRAEPVNGVAARGSSRTGEYEGVEETRWINSTIDGGIFVKLDDGSLWRINSNDVTKTSLWTASESLVVRKHIDPEYPYLLVGKRDNVEAKFIPQ